MKKFTYIIIIGWLVAVTYLPIKAEEIIQDSKKSEDFDNVQKINNAIIYKDLDGVDFEIKSSNDTYLMIKKK